MRMILLYQNGTRAEAIVLAASHSVLAGTDSPDRMRVVIPGCTDTVEFRLKNQQWVSEDGSVAEIEAMILYGRPDLGHFGYHFLKTAA